MTVRSERISSSAKRKRERLSRTSRLGQLHDLQRGDKIRAWTTTVRDAKTSPTWARRRLPHSSAIKNPATCLPPDDQTVDHNVDDGNAEHFDVVPRAVLSRFVGSILMHLCTFLRHNVILIQAKSRAAWDKRASSTALTQSFSGVPPRTISTKKNKLGIRLFFASNLLALRVPVRHKQCMLYLEN